MTTPDVQAKLLLHLRANSGWEQKRNYLGMSNIADCPRALFDRFFHGRPDPTERDHLMCYAGYLFQADVTRRLIEIGLYRPSSERELVAEFDPRFIGHTDGELVTGQLLEIKSTDEKGFDKINETHRCKAAHYRQVMAYMRYGGYKQTVIIYVARESFRHLAVRVNYNQALAEELEEKARYVLSAIDKEERPECVCRRCEQ